MKDVSWNLRILHKESDPEQILGLRKIVFPGEDRDKEERDFWEWEFPGNYAGNSLVYLAEDGDDIVGHYAVCPSDILIDGNRHTGSIVVDVMTHPDYRFQGMFKKIGLYALEDAGRKGVDFSYGFPIRKEVMPGHLSIGWKLVMKIPVLVFPIQTKKIIEHYIHNQALCKCLGGISSWGCKSIYNLIKHVPEYKVNESTSFVFDEHLSEFVEKTKVQHRIIQCRDANFLEWRYHKNRLRSYTIFSVYDDKNLLGYLVSREAEIFGLPCLIIMDIQVLDFSESVIYALLYAVIARGYRMNVALVGCMITKGRYYNAMRRNMFLPSPFSFGFIVHGNNKDTPQEVFDGSNWFLTWADTDDL